jgi:flagellar hook-associated protein 1
MLSTFAGLNTMVRGISSNQLSLNTVGHNITNANTTGYSRQSVNLAATQGQEIYTTYGAQIVGSGVDSTSITRARNIYADKQYWKENSDQSYYTAMQTNYSKVETIFNDSSNTGIQNALESFYSAWSDVSSGSSTSTKRQTVIDSGTAFASKIKTAASQMQQQINSEYDDIRLNVQKVNDTTDKIVTLNKNIATVEASGSSANDLRDQRDNLVDELSKYMNVNVTENPSNGMYTIVSNGTTMVGGINKLNLQLSAGTSNAQYGITDYDIQIKETGTSFNAGNGTLTAEQGAITEDKSYIDKLSNMSAFMMTTFNTQHKAGYGMTGTSVDVSKTGINFYGDNSTVYAWDDTNKQVTATPSAGAATDLKGIQVIDALTVNSKLTGTDGVNNLATIGSTTTTTTASTADPDSGPTTTVAADGTRTTVTVLSGTKTTTVSKPNDTGDGSNAVLVGALFNSKQGNTTDTSTARSIGQDSLNDYYNTSMTALGINAESMNDQVTAQENLVEQVENWRSSTSGVNWNEELTNMIKFQQGYSACSRCLTTMDEMLDKLINSTGTVGR